MTDEDDGRADDGTEQIIEIGMWKTEGGNEQGKGQRAWGKGKSEIEGKRISSRLKSQWKPIKDSNHLNDKNQPNDRLL